MVFSTMVCAGGRLGLRTSGSRILPLASHRPRDCLFSLQRFQPSVDSLPSRQGFSNVRNYWWSKPATPAVTAVELSSPAPAPAAAIPEELAPLASTPSDTITQAVAPALDTTASPDAVTLVPPIDASITVPDLSEAVANVILPLQHGDFAALGLTSWWPAGLIRWSFEVLQVSTGMPWFYTIIAGTLFWRAIVIPNNLASIRSAARLRPHAEEIRVLDEQAAKGDQREKMELMLKKQQVYQKAGVSLKAVMVNPFIQLTANLGLFFAVRQMVTLPVVQLTQSGVWFLPDLTVGDPYYIMPALVAILVNLQVSVMKKDLDPTKPIMAHVMNVMRIASFASVPWMASMPSGLWLSVVTGMVVSTMQSAVLLVPSIRQALSIAPRVGTSPAVTTMDTARAILHWYRNLTPQTAPSPVARQRKPNLRAMTKSPPRSG
ncbi:hypothetical protein PAXINDRAFT_129589 [Paxillus involutus ATCC 200175]|nr:hypothetical protein PAXINDRAFT_129589 [Paxillus involutus ATCC 200175]